MLKVVRYLRTYTMTEAVDVGQIVENLEEVRKRVALAAEKANVSTRPRLVAVSKIKPIEAIIACYDAGQRCFGENYVQELEEKANSPLVLEKCPDIKWHFIGALQSNKVPKVVNSIPNLAVVETVNSMKLAEALNKKRNSEIQLGVMVQVNTSGEEQKSGLSPEEAMPVADFIMDECSKLKFLGFMTIGALEHSVASENGENPDFAALARTRLDFCKRKNVELNSIELSMGMSADFEEAIAMGSTNVRVGSTIFGARAKKI